MEDGRVLIGRQLKRLRLQAGMDLKQFAGRVGCSWQHLCNVESAKGNDRQRHHQLAESKVYRALSVLSEELGREVTLDELVGYLPDEQVAA
jgi:transcriptional regulator with XRE-family HTH domain